MFGFRNVGVLSRIAVSDVPELAQAMREIGQLAMGDQSLQRGLSLLAPVDGSDEAREQVEFETLKRLIGTILNRADATQAETDAELRSIYIEIERARFSTNLMGDVVVPLLAVSFDLDTPLQIDGDIWIEPLTQSEHRVRALPWIRDGVVDPYVAAAATHAIVFKNVEFPNVVHTLRRGDALPEGISVDVAHDVAEAVHIVAGASTGHAQVLVRPHGWAADWVLDLPPLWSCWTGRAYPEELNLREWRSEMSPLSQEDLNTVIRVARGLKNAPRNVQIAARRCRKMTFRDDDEDVVLDLAIGIEALLGREPDALTHRMAQRAAIALSSTIPPESTYKLIKDFYSIRSQIAHGASPKRWTVRLGDREFGAIWIGTLLLRELLQNLLLSEEPWDAEVLDERILSAFARTADDAEAPSRDE